MKNKTSNRHVIGPVAIDTVSVGNAGNAPDTAVMLTDGTSGYGSVGYNYQIGTYPVTCEQYTAFLNAVAKTDPHGLYNHSMSANIYGGIINRSGADGKYVYTTTTPKRPVVYVSFWDALRFANWLTTGDTESGVYALGGTTNPGNTEIKRDSAAWNAGGWAVADENEWYKAAYYSPENGKYFLYPTSNNSVKPDDANYYESALNTVIDVDGYVDKASPYGTVNQGGNVWEWTDAVSGDEYHVLRGGAFRNSVNALESSHRLISVPFSESYFLAFRLSKRA